MNKTLILVATLTLGLSVYGCKSDESTTAVEETKTEKIETVEEPAADGGTVVTEVKEEVKTTKTTTKKKPTAEEKKAAEIKKVEEKIVNGRGKTVKEEAVIKVDEEKLKKEAEIKKAEEDALNKRPKSTKGM